MTAIMIPCGHHGFPEKHLLEKDQQARLVKEVIPWAFASKDFSEELRVKRVQECIL